MVKTIYSLAVASLASGLLMFGLSAATSAREPDAPCYLRDASGRIINLSGMCALNPNLTETRSGNAPSSNGQSPISSPAANEQNPPNDLSSDTKKQECLQLGLTARQLYEEIQGIIRQGNLDPKAIDKLLAAIGRSSKKIKAIQIQDPMLIRLRSEYVKTLDDFNRLARQSINAFKGKNYRKSEQLGRSAQQVAFESEQIGLEIANYCKR